MKLEQKKLKRIGVTTAFSALLLTSIAVPSFAAKEAAIKTVSNELPVAFNVVDFEDTVVLSWDTQLDTNLKTYDVKKDQSQTVVYYVSPGDENDDDLIVDVLLKVPTDVAGSITSISVDGDVIESLYTQDNFEYYLLNQELDVTVGAEIYSDDFAITFDKTTAANTPFTASLVAVQEAVDEPDPEPIVNQTPMPHEDGNFWPLAFNAYSTADANFYFYPQAGADNGTAVIKLGDGIVSFDVANSSYTDYATGTHMDLTNYYNAATNTLTLPISVPQFPLECYLTLKDTVFNTQAGDYTVTVAVDQDGEGTEYSISDEREFTLTLNPNN